MYVEVPCMDARGIIAQNAIRIGVPRRMRNKRKNYSRHKLLYLSSYQAKVRLSHGNIVIAIIQCIAW